MNTSKEHNDIPPEMEKLLSRMPPEFRDMVLKQKASYDAAAENKAKAVGAIIHKEASGVTLMALSAVIENQQIEEDLKGLFPLVLAETMELKVALRETNASLEALRKAHDAWISDQLDED